MKVKHAIVIMMVMLELRLTFTTASVLSPALTLAQDPHGAEAHRVAQNHLILKPL